MAGGTGTGVGPRAEMTLNSRLMSWAVGRMLPRGGRRSTHAAPVESSTRNVRFDRPPAIRWNSSGGFTPSTWSSNHLVTFPTSMPSMGSTAAVNLLCGRNAGRSATVLHRDMIDVTDATFEQDVLERSKQVPVVVDLWAPWCGPCRTLGPTIEKVVDATEGRVELVKVNVDENPRVAATFQVQSIPAVYALHDGKVIDGFIGALPEKGVAEFVARLPPADTEADRLVAAGDEESLRKALDEDPDHEGAVVALADLLAERGDAEEALQLLARIPETAETRRVAAIARLGDEASAADSNGEVESKLDSLLDRVKDDEGARQEFVDLLEVLGPDDPRTSHYRKALTAKLY